MGSVKAVANTKKMLMDRFECEDCGELDDYVGCKIVRINDSALKITQPVIVQSYSDEFDLPNHTCPTPATMVNMLTKADKSMVVSPKEQTKYRSGVGKMMHVMQYSLPQTYNAVRDLARHMSKPADKHTKAMLHCMKHCAEHSDRGLVLQPTRKWDGTDKHLFKVNGKSDSDYAKEPVDRRSVSGSVVMLEGSPVIFRSSTQKHVGLSVTEAELYAGVSTAQNMLYTKNVLGSLGLRVELPMILEMDNMGAVHLTNN